MHDHIARWYCDRTYLFFLRHTPYFNASGGKVLCRVLQRGFTSFSKIQKGDTPVGQTFSVSISFYFFFLPPACSTSIYRFYLKLAILRRLIPYPSYLYYFLFFSFPAIPIPTLGYNPLPSPGRNGTTLPNDTIRLISWRRAQNWRNFLAKILTSFLFYS